MTRNFDSSLEFQELFQGPPALYLILTPDLNIVAASDEYCKATNTILEDILGRGVFEVFPDNPGHLEATGVSKLKESLRLVIQNKHPDAITNQRHDVFDSRIGKFEERHWNQFNSPILDQLGNVSWIVHRVEDIGSKSALNTPKQIQSQIDESASPESQSSNISELANLEKRLVARSIELNTVILDRQRAESILKSEHKFYSTILDNIPAVVFVKDATDLRFVLINKAGEQLFGIDREEYIGKTDHDFFPKEQSDFFASKDREVLQSGKLLVTVDEPIDTRFHGKRRLRTIKMMVPDDQGQPRYLLSLSEDITEKIEAETALKESEIRLRGILRASPDAMIIVDKFGKILLASDHVNSMFGYSSEELSGQPINMLLPERYRHAHTSHVEGFMLQPEGRNMGTGRELNALRKDGSEFPVEINLSPAETLDGLVVIASVRNVTVSRSMEQQLRQAQKMEAIGNLTGGMAHDFNNLLGIIIGNLDLLIGETSEGGITNPLIEKLANQALDAALRGADLTKRLLAFSRRQALRPQHVDVNELVGGITALLHRTLGDDIEIKIEFGTNIWPVYVDPSQLGASIINICNNARDAMPNGGTLTIGTSNKHLDETYASFHPDLKPGDYTLVELSDTGTGIAAESLNKIFEPFFTTKQQDKGTGLGLSMVFGFIKQSAGHITVYSEVEEGTTFRIYLPRSKNAGETTIVSAVSERGGTETILAVEDNEELRKVVVRQLTDLGYLVREAENGKKALQILQSESIDLLFTDIMMPGGMSGYELAKRALVRKPTLKVLLTSGFPDTRLNGNADGPAKLQLLTKPYRKVDLARALRQLLDTA